MEAHQLIFIDESAANERTSHRKYGWAPRGETPILYESIKRSERWSILPAYGCGGMLNWDIIQGSFTTELFVQFIENKVLPMCTPYPGSRSIIVLDNAPIHKDKVCNLPPPSLHPLRSYIYALDYTTNH
ncbi:MAG: hypothetical protein E6J34_22940 [Chloroflexi bacterium]|nr:MAG: hypothetical protein E6J34_22940 [Chloroflexota bacterium]